MNTLTMMRYYEGSKKAKAEIKLTRKDNKYNKDLIETG